MRALLVANSVDADAGFVGDRFRHHGYSFVECHRERPGEWPALDGVDLVLLLGSEWSVYWPDVADSVDIETTMIATAQRRGIPQFGICFGNQTMARALGGSVARGRESEIGWYHIDTDLPAVIPSGPWLQWHSDVVTVPPGAEELARSPIGPQAWRAGRSLCTQFHPEATETMLAKWTQSGSDELVAFGSTVTALMAETRRQVVDSSARADRLVDWFLAEVAGS